MTRYVTHHSKPATKHVSRWRRVLKVAITGLTVSWSHCAKHWDPIIEGIFDGSTAVTVEHAAHWSIGR